MRRSPFRRLLGALLAPWFVLLSANPALAHQCAMHGAGALHGTGAMHHDAMDGADHDAMASAHASHAPSPSHGDHAACTCDDGSCCAAVAIVVPETPVFRVAPPQVRDAAPRPAADLPVVVATGTVLPFANGPPVRT